MRKGLLFRSLFAALVVFTASVVVAGPGDGVEDKEQALQHLREQIEQTRARADALADDEQQQLARLHELEREMSLTSELLERLALKEIAVRAQIDTLQAQIEAVQARVVARRERLAQRLRAIYMRPRWSVLSAAFTSRSLTQLQTRLRAMTHVARTENALIEDVQEAQADLRERRGELARQMAEIHLTRSETEDRRLQLERLQTEKHDTLVRLRQERARFEASVDEMERAAQEMEKLIAALEQQRRARGGGGDGAFAALQGSLPWPVRGPVLRPYGRSVHPQFKTVVVNKGLNIGAAAGTPIHVVAPGTVKYVDWLPGYGKCIIVDHGDGFYTLYAHAAAIYPAEGALVGAGEVIGEVGDTGSLNGAQLYFEIRKGKESLDPATWLSRGDG